MTEKNVSLWKRRFWSGSINLRVICTFWGIVFFILLSVSGFRGWQKRADRNFLRTIRAVVVHAYQPRVDDYLTKGLEDWLSEEGVKDLQYVIESPYYLWVQSSLSHSESVQLHAVLQRNPKLKVLKINGNGIASTDQRDEGECNMVTQVLAKLSPQVKMLIISDWHQQSDIDNSFAMEHFFTDQTIAKIQKPLSRLEVLFIRSNAISDDGLRNLLPASQLTCLVVSGGYLNHSPVTDASMGYLSKISSLEVLKLPYSQITGVQFEQLEALSSLSELDLSGNQILPEHVEKLARISSLKELTITLKGSRDQEVDISCLEKLTQVKKIRIAGNRVTEEQLENLKSALPACSISVSGHVQSGLQDESFIQRYIN